MTLTLTSTQYRRALTLRQSVADVAVDPEALIRDRESSVRGLAGWTGNQRGALLRLCPATHSSVGCTRLRITIHTSSRALDQIPEQLLQLLGLLRPDRLVDCLVMLVDAFFQARHELQAVIGDVHEHAAAVLRVRAAVDE